MSPEQVAEALSHKCDMCGAAPNCECTSIIDGKPLREARNGMTVHYYRKDCI